MTPARTRRQVRLGIAVAVTTLMTLFAASTSALAAGAADHDPDPDCDELVTYSATAGAQGDQRAVAITSQSLDAEIAGWGHISWEAAPSTSVAAVVATGPTGTRWLTDGELSSGTLDDVLAVTFCTGAAVEPVADEADETISGGSAVGGGDGGGTTTAGGAATETVAAGTPAAQVLVAPAVVDTITRAALGGAGVDPLAVPAAPATATTAASGEVAANTPVEWLLATAGQQGSGLALVGLVGLLAASVGAALARRHRLPAQARQ